MMQPNDAIAIFCCYASEDEDLFHVLQMHLSSLQRRNVVTVWHRKRISAGVEWKQEIKAYLDEARIILLLMSSNFINSDDCCSIEMPYALIRHKERKARVIPILLRHVSGWEKIPPGDLQLGHLEALPKERKPVTSLADQDGAWKEVVEGIEGVANELLSSHPCLLLTSDKDCTFDERKDPLFIKSSSFPQPASDTCSSGKSPFYGFFEIAMGLIQAALGGIENAEKLFQPSYKASDAVKRRSALDSLETVLQSLDQLRGYLETTPLPEKSKRYILRDQIHKLIEHTQTLHGWVNTSNSAYQCIFDQIEATKQAFTRLSGLIGGDSTRQ